MEPPLQTERPITKRAWLYRRWVTALRLDELAVDRAEAAIWQVLAHDGDATASDRAFARARLAASEYLDARRETRIAREVARMRLLLAAGRG